MIRDLITDKDTLSVRTKEADIKDHERIEAVITDLTDTLNSLDESVLYLTANQIGMNERVVAMRFTDGIKIFVNPSIQRRAKAIIFREKDYLTKEEYFIPRFTELSIVYQEKDNAKLVFGVVKGVKLNEASSIIMCQALDSLNGMFTSDYGLQIIPEFDEASEEEKAEVLRLYIDSLKEAYDTADKELSEDEETKTRWGASKFVTALARGDIEEIPEELSNRKKKKIKKFLKRMGLWKSK